MSEMRAIHVGDAVRDVDSEDDQGRVLKLSPDGLEAKVEWTNDEGCTYVETWAPLWSLVRL